MKSQILAILFAASVGATTCNHDNALRCLISDSVIATKFCSSYISIPVVTSTVTYTPVTTTFQVSTTTTTAIPNLKRDALDELNAFGYFPKISARTLPTSSPAPACLSATSYPASRISSACSCLSIAPSTKSVTKTAPISKVTVKSVTTTTTTAQSIPTTFQIVAHAPGTAADGVLLGGVLDENFFVGFGLPWGTPLTLTLDTATGWVHSGDIYLQASFTTDGPAGSAAWVLTNSLGVHTPDIETAITCSILADLSLHCAAGSFYQFQIWQYLGDGIPRLAIAPPGDTSIPGFIANVELSVIPA